MTTTTATTETAPTAPTTPTAPTAATSRRRLDAYAVAVGLAFALGAALRLLGYFSRDLQLWLDEATWAQMLVDGTAAWIRPAGYMWLTGRLVDIVDNEPMLRSLSLVAGLVQLPLVFLLLRRALSSRWVAWAGLYLVAINPIAVAMSKEFKPYELEATFHVALLLCAIVYAQEKTRRSLVALVTIAVVAPLFAWSVAFVYPTVFAVTGWFALRGRRHRDLAIVLAGGLASLVVLALIFHMKVAGENERTAFWGAKYGVFYLGHDFLHAIRWYALRTAEVAASPAHFELAVDSPLVTLALRVVAGVACAAGAVVLVGARRLHAALFLAPWAVTVVFNYLGKWPYGLFRTNVFLIVYATLIVCVAFDAAAVRLRTRPQLARAGAVAFAILGVVVFPYDFGAFRVKPESALALSSSVRAALEEIVDAESGAVIGDAKARLLVDGHACGIVRYYALYHHEARVELGPYLQARVTQTCGGYREKGWRELLDTYAADAAEVAEPFWVLTAKPALGPVAGDELAKVCRSVHEEELPAGTFLFRCEP